MPGIFVTGTHSNVGKTHFVTSLVKALREKGVDAVPYKPVQCGATEEGTSPDADMYRSVYEPDLGDVLCTYLFDAKVSPHLAASLEDRLIEPERILRDYAFLEKMHDIVIVEGSGGIAVPLIDEQYGIPELMNDLNLPGLLIADAGIGTLNQTTMTAAYANSKNVDLRGIVLNRFPELPSIGVRHNPEMLERTTGLPILGKVADAEEPELSAYRTIYSDFLETLK
ncbi:dethiobiotin synthase [Salimicrobium flavidum]|uniref:ATP-dependent dethiobiotin synthetase BioD n=1 Tax=Salimicrobium flavidum TaxID=570947 RepID=A0A1N7IRW7_9BACI|nr:dethiobiotin synthase [Salimicrobium flavidum]SIS39828.1 dethiobiotin synthase [Salimicrobium flavidum]